LTNPSFETFADVLEFRAREQGKRLAFRFLGDGEVISAEWTYEELDRQARLVGKLLSERGAFGQRVLLIYPPGLEYIAALFGCFYASAVAVPAYPPRSNHNLERLQSIQQDSDASLILTTPRLLDQLQSILEGTLGASSIIAHQTGAAGNTWQRSKKVNPLALIQYTSASTGHPKGVKVTHRNLLHNSSILKEAFEYTSESCCVSWLPAYHDMGLVGGVLQPVFGGFPCTLLSPIHFLQRPMRWLEAISRFQATISGGPNFAYDLCVRRLNGDQIKELDLSTWSVAFNGAEPVSANTMRQFEDTFADYGFRANAFFPCYGLAEATLIVSGGPAHSGPFIKEVHAEYLNKTVPHERVPPTGAILASSGQLLEGVEVRIVDPESRTLCGPNQVGEIWIHSESCADGYWGAPDESAAVFEAHLAASDGPTFLRSGDLGLLFENQLFVTGRIKDLIIIRGVNHYPQDIEGTVQRSHLAFDHCPGAAFSIQASDQEALVVVQEIQRHREPEAVEAASRARQALATVHALRPCAFVVVKQGTTLKTTSGKIQRWAVKEAFLKDQLNIVAQWAI